MKTSTRVPLLYLAGSLGWLVISAWIGPSPASPFPPFLGFILVSTALLYAMLRQDARRHDAVECDLRAKAIHDPLTGLLNRASFSDNLERAISRAAREEANVAVAFIDLDGFKAVNDCHGHMVGDQLLTEVADRIRMVIRSADCAGRFGGDEFVVLFEGEHEDGAYRLMERLRVALSVPFTVAGQRMEVTASVGVALYPQHGKIGENLLRAADKAMYCAKESGKNAACMALSPAA